MTTNVDVLAVMYAARWCPRMQPQIAQELGAARAAVAELIERLEATNWRLEELLALIPENRPERAQVERDMADNRAALARVKGR